MRLDERLIETARPRENGCSWRTIEVPMIDDLTGLSRGGSGIALALLDLAAVTHPVKIVFRPEDAIVDFTAQLLDTPYYPGRGTVENI